MPTASTWERTVGPATSEKMLGDIAEIVLYDADQSAAGTEPQIASYLALKYGITLSHSYLASNGTTVWNLDDQHRLQQQHRGYRPRRHVGARPAAISKHQHHQPER